jgi:hypothetical protein
MTGAKITMPHLCSHDENWLLFMRSEGVNVTFILPRPYATID